MKPRVHKALREVKLLPEHRAKVLYAGQGQYGTGNEVTRPSRVARGSSGGKRTETSEEATKVGTGTRDNPAAKQKLKPKVTSQTVVGRKMALQPPPKAPKAPVVKALPAHHAAYVRRDKKSGKLSQVKQLGSPSTKPAVQRHMLPDVTGQKQYVLKRLTRGKPGTGQDVRLSKKELDIVLNGGVFALISAGRNPASPADKSLSDKQISERHERLRSNLVEDGFKFSSCIGHYGDVEDSFLVMLHNADRDYVRHLGKDMNQDSVIYSDRGRHEVHYTTGEHVGEGHKGGGHTDMSSASDYYTEMVHSDGTKSKFQLNLDFDQYEKMRKALMTQLRKAEGSRGGHIIGHTKSGKAIYGVKHPRMNDLKSALHSYSSQDHKDALEAHGAETEDSAANDKMHKLHTQFAEHKSKIEASKKKWDETVASVGQEQTLVTKKAIMKPDIRKAGGPGSRGGQVIGHTKSGKPVYADAGGHNKHDYAKFTKQDHLDAQDHHEQEGWRHEEEHEDSADTHGHLHDKTQHHLQRAEAHSDIAEEHAEAAERLTKKATMKPDIRKAGKGAGSRGGKVIGHTKSGKAIYAKGNKAAFKDGHTWTHSDHKEAADTHEEHMGRHKEGSSAYGHHDDWRYEHRQEAKAILPPKVGGHHVGPTRFSHKKKKVTKAITATTKENNMSEQLEDIFKSELGGDAEAPITKCIHCEEPLTKSDLAKGLGTHFVKDDNDQPHSGGKGQVSGPRAGAAAKANDPVAPLLKGTKHGDAEEFLISKSEMEAMGMDITDVDDGEEDYVITKSELVRMDAGDHVDYLRYKKILKGCPDGDEDEDEDEDGGEEGGEGEKPDLMKMKKAAVKKSVHEGPQGLAPGVLRDPGGNALTQWFNSGDDAAIAKSIEEGALGQGSDEPIKRHHAD